MKTITTIRKELNEKSSSRVRELCVDYIDNAFNFRQMTESQVIFKDIIYHSEEKETKIYKELIEKDNVIFIIEIQRKYNKNFTRENVSYFLTAINLENLEVDESNYFLYEKAKANKETQGSFLEDIF
jgi:hypothetical protein